MPTYSRTEAANRAGLNVELLGRMVELGILKPTEGDRFSPGDARRAEMVKSLEKAGIPMEGLAAAIRGGTLSLDFFDAPLGLVAVTNVTAGFERLNVYAYHNWQPIEPLQIIGGVSYDWLKYPQNFRAPPVLGGESHTDRVSPKAGVIWTPWRDTTLRGAYSRSLGGVSFDQSFQLEPSQLAGFQQTFRSLIPESVKGALAAQRYETFGAAVDQKFRTRTYVGLSAELLKSDSTQTLGTYDFVFPSPAAPGSTRERLKFEEKSLRLTLNQLLSDEWALGAQYRLTHADLRDSFLDIPSTASINSARFSLTLRSSSTMATRILMTGSGGNPGCRRGRHRTCLP